MGPARLHANYVEVVGSRESRRRGSFILPLAALYYGLMASDLRLRRTVASFAVNTTRFSAGVAFWVRYNCPWVTGGAVGLDAGIQVSRGANAYPRLRGYPRSCPEALARTYRRKGPGVSSEPRASHAQLRDPRGS